MNERSEQSYTESLRAVVAASAFPYGYTLTVWTSGAVLSHARGTPTTVDAFLYMIGAIAAYGVVAVGAFRGLRSTTPTRPRAFSLWEATHLVSVALAIGVAALVAHLVTSIAAWPLGSFLGTAVYLAGTALQMSLGRPG